MTQGSPSLYGHCSFDDTFPRAIKYRADSCAHPLVREKSSGSSAEESFTERHLQCIWFDPSLRPKELSTSEGERVQVEYPGDWNLEAGPDFLHAAIRVGNSRRIEGDAEIHIHPADWDHHGHPNDPRYRNVRIHVTYFASGKVSLPAGCVELSMQKSLRADPVFSFHQIDLAAYPYAVRGQITACAKFLADLSPEKTEAMLEAAGEERLRQKTVRFAQMLSASDPEQVLYREMFTALGYKHNNQAFRALAENVPLLRLRDASGGDPLAAYAILLGCANLLPKELPSRSHAEARNFVRRIWDLWWKLNSPWTEIPASAWRLSGLRPSNHPARRLMAGAYLFTRNESFAELLRLAAGDAAHIMELLMQPSGTFWDYYLSFNGLKQKSSVALIGDSRAAAIITNIFIPWLAAQDELVIPAAVMLDGLPCDALDSIAKMTAHHLFGPVHNPRLYRSSLRHQGLLQIFSDFCLQDRSDCSHCKFPDIIKRNFATKIV